MNQLPTIKGFDLDEIKKTLEAFEKKNKVKPELGLVFYSDGGGLTGENPVASYGLHGVLYIDNETKQGLGGVPKHMLTQLGYAHNDTMKAEQPYIDPYGEDTRAMEKENYRIVTPIFYIEALGSVKDGTNNIGELMGTIRGFQIATYLLRELDCIKRIHFRIDSKYVIQAISRLDILRNNGWKKSNGDEIKNKELIQFLDSTYTETGMYLKGVKVSIQWVAGHAEWVGNIRADKLASTGLVGARNRYFFDEAVISPAKGFWNTKVKPHYFFADARIYTRIDLLPNEDNRTLYIGTHKEDNRVAQNSGDFFQAVVRLPVIPEVIDRITHIASRFDDLDDGNAINGLYSGQLNTLLDSNYTDYITCHNGALLSMNKFTREIYSPDKKLLLSRLPLDGTSQMLVDRLNRMEGILDTIGEGNLPAHWHLNDVTDKFYKVTEKKNGSKELKFILANEDCINFDVELRNVGESPNTVITKSTTAPITFGVVAPQRRTFGGIRDENPTVSILTIWHDPASFEFFTIVKLDGGAIGIWGNMASNRKGFI